MVEKNVKRISYKTKDVIDAILKLRIEKGLSRPSILEWLVSEMKLSKYSASKMLNEANKKFDEIAVQRFGNDIKEDIERFEALYEKAVKNNETREAREILKEISKLKGHYVERFNIDVKEYQVKFPGLDE
jgi:hypothetical protein